jgi:DNA-binding MarR family transcriptional regulator
MPLLMLKDLPRYECLLEAAEHYPELDPSAHEVFLNLLRTADLVFAEKGKLLARHNISHGRFTVLMLLNRCGKQLSDGHTPATLAEAAGVTRATMTGLIDTLEKDGFVIRGSDLVDRRITKVHLTSQGSSFIEAMLPDYFQCVSGVMNPLQPTERKLLVDLLFKLQERLEVISDNTSQPQLPQQVFA